MKPKKCKECGSQFVPSRPFQKACGIECAIALGRKASEKKKLAEAKQDRALTRSKLVALKPKTAEKKAEEAFNLYVRLRDRNEGCISCTLPASWGGQWHASHYRSVGAASGLRFNLWNVHKACSVCNNYRSGNIAGYREPLIRKIGIEKFEWLGSQNKPVKFTPEYLERVRRIFAKKARRLERKFEET